jgi:glycosyltransferase involved in cell wall biosynthesis
LTALVSVIIPAYNRAVVIGAAIESVLNQRLPSTEAKIEIIVVDDGSDDDLVGALRPFREQVRLIRHEKNLGAAAARNTGIISAKCDYLAFLDSDDVWHPNKLATQIAFMRSGDHPVSCTACNLARLERSPIVWPRYKNGFLTRADAVWGCYLSPGTTMVCEPRIFTEIGLFDTSLQRHEDWDWLLRLTAHRDLAFLSEPLASREPSGFGNHRQTLHAIEDIRRKHLSQLPPHLRRCLEAALALEIAAVRYRQRNWLATVAGILNSLWLAPISNAAVSTIVAGRLAQH